MRGELLRVAEPPEKQDPVESGSDSDQTRSDRAWFDLVYADNADLIWRYAVRRVGEIAADDVVSEVFLTAWRRRDHIERHDVRLWLYGVAAKVVANEHRRGRRHLRLVGALGGESRAAEAPDLANAVGDTDLVRQALARLADGDAETLRLIEWDGLDVAEAAQVVGCRQATFRVRLHRARTRFANALALLDRTAAELARGGVDVEEGER